MGLDYTAIVMEAEERFGVKISDSEASQMRTVGEFYELMLGKLPAGESQVCLTAVAFFRIRRALARTRGIDRRQVGPDLALANVLPIWRRRRDWSALADAMALRIPGLKRPAALGDVGAWAIAVVFVAGICLSETDVFPLWATWCLGALMLPLAAVLTRPLAVHLSGDCRTVGDLSRAVLDMNAGELARSVGGAGREEIWRSLVRLISEQLGVLPDEITPASRFVEDLGCG